MEGRIFVSADWVQDQVLDGDREYLVAEVGWGPAATSPYRRLGCLPGAVYLDTAMIEGGPVWKLLPAQQMEKNLLALGISWDRPVLLYGPDPQATARVATALLWAGVEEVRILNLSLDKWVDLGHGLESRLAQPQPRQDFGRRIPAHPELVLSMDEVKRRMAAKGKFRLVSVRSYSEYIGQTSGYAYIDRAGEPAGALWGRGGSSAYSSEDFVKEDGRVISLGELVDLWEGAGFTLQDDLAFYCGTSWRACIPFLLLYQAGYEKMAVFDGGWLEWQADEDNLVQLGDPRRGPVEVRRVGQLATNRALVQA